MNYLWIPGWVLTFLEIWGLEDLQFLRQNRVVWESNITAAKSHENTKLVGYLFIAQLLQPFMFSGVRGFMIKGSSDSCEMLNFGFYPSSQILHSSGTKWLTAAITSGPFWTEKNFTLLNGDAVYQLFMSEELQCNMDISRWLVAMFPRCKSFPWLPGHSKEMCFGIMQASVSNGFAVTIQSDLLYAQPTE